MSKKRIGAALAIAAVLGLAFFLHNQTIPGGYAPADDEIALYSQLAPKEDIGLLVFDYSANGSNQSGGMSNADKSLMKHDERLINVWTKETLQCSADTVALSIQFRIITEYVDPNYENIYPDGITKYADAPIAWDARFGESYFITITGDQANGYKAVLNEREQDAKNGPG